MWGKFKIIYMKRQNIHFKVLLHRFSIPLRRCSGLLGLKGCYFTTTISSVPCSPALLYLRLVSSWFLQPPAVTAVLRAANSTLHSEGELHLISSGIFVSYPGFARDPRETVNDTVSQN